MKLKKAISLLTGLALAGIPLMAESTDPELLKGSMPEYPEVARTAGVAGIVIVEALIDESGNVFAADVVQSPSEVLNAATLAAVRNWKFSPATEDGKAAMKVVRIPINFNLVDPYGEAILQSQDRAIAAR